MCYKFNDFLAKMINCFVFLVAHQENVAIEGHKWANPLKIELQGRHDLKLEVDEVLLADAGPVALRQLFNHFVEARTDRLL